MTPAVSRSAGFFAVSALCLITHNVVMITGDARGLPLTAALALSFIVVVILGYVGHSLFTYHEPLGLGRFARYILAMAVNLPTAFVTVWFAREVTGLPMLFAAPLSTIVSIGINYMLSRWAIMYRQPAQD